MFEVFRHRVVQELGPLHPNWFEELTAKASTGTGNDALVEGPQTPRGSCAQEDAFKVPLDKPATDSQISSTPKIFKCQTAQSPEPLTQDEELHFTDRAKLPIDTAGHNSLWIGLGVSAKRISESLGAQIDPDVSWTSSLNTPEVMSPTIILTKKEDSICSVTPSGDKRVIFVRKLFPSASKLFEITERSTEKHNSPSFQQSEVNSQSDSLMKKTDDTGLTPVNERNGLWRQTLPDAIQDGEVRSTVASVLDGAEDALSIFFGDSGSALRRVRAKERGRRRQAGSPRDVALTPPTTLGNGCSEEPVAVAAGGTQNGMEAFASAPQRGSSLETQDCGITQWTPLTLSDISDTNLESTVVPAAALPSSVNQLKLLKCAALSACLTFTGFKTASNSTIHLSSENLLKAKRLFEDIEEEDLPGKLSTRKDRSNIKGTAGSKEESRVSKSSAGHTAPPVLSSLSSEPKCADTYGFLTASQRADVTELCSLLEEADSQFEFTQFKQVKLTTSAAPDVVQSDHPSDKEVDPDFLSGIDFDDSFSSDCEKHALRKQRAAASDVGSENISSCNPQGNCGFSTAGGKKVTVSKKALHYARSLLQECAEIDHPEPENSKASNTHISSLSPQDNNSGGFKLASGKGVSIPQKALEQAKAFFKNCDDAPESEMNRTVQGKHIGGKIRASLANLAQSSHGFTSASGKEVSVSAECLAEVRAMFGNRDDTVDTAVSAEVKEGMADANFHHTSHGNQGKIRCGFSTAGGKRVSVSESALRRANALLNECGEKHHTESGRLEFTRGSAQELQHGNSCSFSTASGKGVAVSAKALQEAKALFRDCDDTSSHEIRGTMKGEAVSTDSSAGHNDLDKGNCGFTTARGMRVSVSKKALLKAKALLNECSPGQERCAPRKAAVELEAWEMMQSNVGGATQESSSILNLRLPGFSDCTVTQQRYFEQEAVACTRALLEDEDLGEQGHQGAPGEPPHQPDAERSGGGGKRPKSEDSDLKGQPPLKRRLLEDFDRTSDCGKTTALAPVKSSPNGVRDRRVFKYGVPLQPNVTRPFGKTGSSHGGQTPPCLPEAPATPSVFTPPFKKNSDSATNPGGDSKVSVQVSVTCGDMLDNTCDDSSGQGIVRGGVPEEREAESKKTTLAPASPLHHEAGSSDTERMIENLQLARDMQDMRIRKKKRQTVRPQPGSLFLAKTSGVTRVSLRSAVGGACPVRHTQEELYKYGVHRGVSGISSASAESFRFRCRDFFREEVLTEAGGVQLADGGWLIPSNDGTAGKEEFYRALCDTPGVDPKLISEAWLYNHYRWVVWKRASLERSFPEVMGSQGLTPEQVLLQLKYRYDVEVDHSRRPALRKIMERDDTPAKTLVLCVCGIASTGSTLTKPVQPESKASPGTAARAGSPNGVIWVTDGWYSIKALLDAPLTAMLQKGQLTVGGKVVTHGAELVGSQDACPPLEAPESLMLKISANSTRPARWDTKLGFHRDPRPFRLPLSSLYSSGGLVGCVDVVVLRSYPTQWMEKKPGGVFVFRNDRAEEREAQRHSDSKHKAMEVLFAKIQAQFEKDQEAESKTKKRRRRMSLCEIEALRDGEELYEAVESDPVYFESCLSEQQLAILGSYRQSLGQERQARLQEQFRRALEEAQEGEGVCSNREVTPVWKLSVCDGSDQQSSRVCLLNIWRPSMELRSLLKEGSRYRVYQLATSEGKKRAGKAAVQLTATKKTKFEQIKAPPESLPELFQPRVSVSFRTLRDPGFRPLCGEVDIVGCVISIADRHGPSPVLHLMDEQQDFVSVRSSSSLAQLTIEDLVKPQALLAISNLQLQHQPSKPIPALYAGELSVFSTKPKEAYLQEACARLRAIVQANEHFFEMAEEKLSDLIQSNGPRSLLSSREVSPSPKMVSRRADTPQQSLRTSGLFTPVSRKPPLLVSTSDNRDPKSLKRKRGLDFLSRIPSPPPLSPVWTTASPSVKKTFNPPRRCETPQPTSRKRTPAAQRVPPPEDGEWVNDEELAMINTQALLDGWGAR
ncbi:breast cancer type 2 susceptibility protein [Megalops cyprinoides]|uniref:breast cancer type 2 susceptibility protein n=1 Tax=Megalops cyprinoides TaxID=118141 RepID=UPI001863E797|nr:breast cancer type 2 susceptibility protein [Megalops cyprinoides]